MVNFFVIIVLYNKRLDESVAYSSLKAAANRCESRVSFLIVDNSTNEEIKSSNRDCSTSLEYLDMLGNKGLPAAYNQAIDRIDKTTDNWIVISDQDTKYESEYFNKLEDTVKSCDSKAIAPQVTNSRGLMSPFTLKHDCIPGLNRFINSGLAVKSDVFLKIKYNEELFLDFVDYDLANEFHKNGIDVKFINAELFQDFSGTDFTNKEAAIKRYEIYIKDADKYYSKWEPSSFNRSYYVKKRTLNLSWKFRTTDFIKLYRKRN